MIPMFALIKREFTAYFLSPVGYVTLVFFLVVTGLLFLEALTGLTRTGTQGVEYPMAAIVGSRTFWSVFAFIPPLLTMRLFAEERATGTLESLLTAPIRDWQVVAGKFIGAALFYKVLWLPTLLYVPILLDMKWNDGQPTCGIDPMTVIGGYVGVLLAGKMFLALGLFLSSLVKNQLIAAMISLAAVLVFVVPGAVLPLLDANTPLAGVLRYLSVPDHLRNDFARGIFDIRHIVLYVSVTLASLYLTVRSLEARRLNA